MSNLKSLFFAAILLVGGITAVNAQITQGSRLKVNIPNPFVLNDKTFAAGQYTIERTPSTIDSPSMMVMSDSTGRGLIVFDTNQSRSNDAARSTQLVFDNVNGTYFLSQIWVKGSITSSDIPLSRSTRRMIARRPVHKVVITTDTGL